MDLKIVNLKNKWSNDFEQKNNANFFNIDLNFKIDMKKLADYKFITPDVSELEWSIILQKSKIKETILEMI